MAQPPPARDGEVPKRRGPGRPRLLEPSLEYRARQEEIIAAAAAVFHDKGYDAGTLDDVAVALDLRRASLYHYVRSKAELLRLIFERALDRALGELDEALKIDDPGARLEALIRHQAHTVTRDPSLFSVFFDHRPRLQADYAEGIRKRERRYLDAYRAAVRAAVAAGAIGDVDARYATQAIFGMTTWSYKWFQAARDDPVAFADVCVELILGPRPASA
ncbi:MAG: TetR/AcrR family transcriptional regulator [Actinomycetota bacterium]|jgi:TetR/AcrR family transcriptional regulator, cholesterol catabolism regulator